MAEPSQPLRWGVEKRLEFIDFRLFWEGAINRSDLVGQFDVSVPQASNDLSRYEQLAPGNLQYDKSEKRYVRTGKFKPVFHEPSADRYLAELQKKLATSEPESLESWLSNLPEVAVLPTLHRSVSVELLRAVRNAIAHGRALEIEYQSMSPKRPDPTRRWISPHAFASDGFRWHVRAYCHIDNKFKDFLLSRILDVGDSDEPKALSDEDHLWNDFLKVVLVPNPDLAKAQRRVIALDYGMDGDRIELPVRKALLYYFKKRLRLDIAEALGRPQEAPVVVENVKEFEIALAESSA